MSIQPASSTSAQTTLSEATPLTPPQATTANIAKQSLLTRPNPVLSCLIPKTIISEMYELESRSFTNETKRTHSVPDFFQRWGIAQRPNNPFTAEDVQTLYQMLEQYPMSHHLTFHAFFGLKFSTLFDTLATSPHLGKIFDEGRRTKIIRTLQEYYMSFYANLLSTPTGPVNVYSEDNINIILHSRNSMREACEEAKRAQQQNASSSTVKKMQEKLHNTAIEPFLREWEKTWTLYEKFLSHNQAQNLMEKTLLKECLGINEVMPLSTTEHMQMAGKFLCQYMTFIKNCTNNPNRPLPSNVSSLFQLPINPQIFESPVNIEKIQSDCTILFNIIYQNVGNLRTLLDTGTHSETMLCCQRWLVDFLQILQSPILPLSDPLYSFKTPHEKRAVLLSGDLYSQSLLTKSKTHPLFENNSFPKEFVNMYINFFESIEKLQIGNILLKVSSIYKHALIPRLIIKDELSLFHRQLKSLTESFSKQLHAYSLAHRDQLEGLPLLEMTQELAKACLIAHDLETALYGQSNWDCEFPLEYLHFLTGETGVEEEESPATTVFHTVVAHEGENSPLFGATLETKEPPPLTLANTSASSSQKNQKPKIVKKTNPAAPPKEEKPDRLRISQMSQTQRFRIFTMLGLTSIERKGHRQWVTSDGRRATTEKRHGKIGEGLGRAMEQQIATALSPPPITKYQEKKKAGKK